MEIKKEWFKENFEQIFYLFCREKEFEIKKYNESLADVKRKSYICREKQIKIEEL